jgi:hypothetical protein
MRRKVPPASRWRIRQRQQDAGGTLLLLLALATLLLPSRLHAADPDGDHSHILLRLSAKFLQRGADGPNATRIYITNTVMQANSVLDEQWRGFRFTLAENITVEPEAAGVALPSRTVYLTNSPPSGPRIAKQISLMSFYRWWQTTNSALPTYVDDPGRRFYVSPDLMNSNTANFVDIMSGMFINAMRSNRVAFAYRTNAANMYFIWPEYYGGMGAFTGNNHNDNNIFYMSGASDVSLIIHEFGHYSDLPHPFAEVDGQELDKLGDDGIADTPEDVWGLSEGMQSPTNTVVSGRWNPLANRMYARAYNTLNADEQLQVRIMAYISHLRWPVPANPTNLTAAQIQEIWLTWENIMSYHKGADPNHLNWWLSEQQMDIWSDVYREIRHPIATGRTLFIGGARDNLSKPPGNSHNSHTNIAQAVSAAAATGDILMIRPGSYNEPMTINKTLTLRATRNGPVTIGR